MQHVLIKWPTQFRMHKINVLPQPISVPEIVRYQCKNDLDMIFIYHEEMETFSALLSLCVRNSAVTGEFPSQWPVTRSFDVCFDLRLNNRLRKQSKHRRFDTSSCSSWRHRNVEHVAWWPLHGLIYWYVVIKSNLCNLLEDRTWFKDRMIVSVLATRATFSIAHALCMSTY